MIIGILGGGQLARMLSLAAHPLGWETRCYSPQLNPCAAPVTTVINGAYEDQKQLKHFAEQVDVITCENENIPLETMHYLEQLKPCYPNANTLATTQDRWLEKKTFQQLSIPTLPYEAIDEPTQLTRALSTIGYPALLKARRFGYDGKGQATIQHADEQHTALSAMNQQPAILEQWLAFDYEISIIAVRNQNNECVYYPLTKNEHRAGILRVSQAPHIDETIFETARGYADALLHHFNYVGVLTIEFFVTNNKLIANEMAPRVHNSGHWSIEGAVTSQFENHLRAIAGYPLGSIQAIGNTVMYNCIGTLPSMKSILAIPGAHFHDYTKTPRPNRKLGHITVHNTSQQILTNACQQVENALSM